MTKQHLVAFASEINSTFALTTVEQLFTRPAAAQVAVNSAISIVCSIARQFNPKFDEARFRAACFAK